MTFTTDEYTGVKTLTSGINAGRCVTIEDAAIYYADELYSLISDLSKEANGCRMRFDHTSKTFEELNADVDYYANAADEAAAEEVERKAQNVEDFKALVDNTIELGAMNEETALRWLTQSETFYHSQSVEHWVYNHGILFTPYGKEIVTKLMDIVTFEGEMAA